jgi:hypothetical protein
MVESLKFSGLWLQDESRVQERERYLMSESEIDKGTIWVHKGGTKTVPGARPGARPSLPTTQETYHEVTIKFDLKYSSSRSERLILHPFQLINQL